MPELETKMTILEVEKGSLIKANIEMTSILKAKEDEIMTKWRDVFIKKTRKENSNDIWKDAYIMTKYLKGCIKLQIAIWKRELKQKMLLLKGCKKKNKRIYSPLCRTSQNYLNIALLCMILWYMHHIELVERG